MRFRTASTRFCPSDRRRRTGGFQGTTAVHPFKARVIYRGELSYPEVRGRSSMAGFVQRRYECVVIIRVLPAVRSSLCKDIATRHQTERVRASRQESTEVDIGAQRSARASPICRTLMRSCCEHFASVRIRFAILPAQRRRQLSRVCIVCLRLWTNGENVNTA